MLQQTQAARVVEAFDRFLRRFPNINSLARASDDAVLAGWRGLGYYRRAIQLRDAAIIIRDRFQGQVPHQVEQLRELPGIGRYTAGAIASVAFGKRAAIVDGNVRRVILRCSGRADQDVGAASRESLWNAAQVLVDASSRPGLFNEGIMELGAVVCTPASPRCDKCPIAEECIARRDGLQDEIPRPAKPAIRQTIHHHVVVVRARGQLLLERRGNQGLWRRMWQAPTIESARQLNAAGVLSRLRIPVQSLRHIESFHHRTTHRDVVFHVFHATTRAKMGKWVARASAERMPLSNPQRRILLAAAKAKKDGWALARPSPSGTLRSV
jgi:A/G-specific adenine glycosylase